MAKRIHFEPAKESELEQGRRELAAWFEQLPPEIRAEIEAQAEAEGKERPAQAPGEPRRRG